MHYELRNHKTHFCNYIREDEGIIDFTESEKMDLIAVCADARKGLAQVFNSITENVVNHIQTPIWNVTRVSENTT